jgi:hypothetical protein
MVLTRAAHYRKGRSGVKKYEGFYRISQTTSAAARSQIATITTAAIFP